MEGASPAGDAELVLTVGMIDWTLGPSLAFWALKRPIGEEQFSSTFD